MIDEKKTLGELLSDPLIEKIAPDAIRKMDLTKDEKWGKSLAQLRQDCFGGDLAAGFETLFRAANKEGKGNAMRRAAKQIVICAAALILFCVVCRLLFFRSYTAHINVHYPQSEEFRQPRIEAEQDIVRLEKSVWHDPVLSVRVQPGKTPFRALSRGVRHSSRDG